MNIQSDDFLFGYAVGLMVGEGTFSGDKHCPAIAVKLHENNPEPLELLKKLFGGTIYGPYHHGGRNYKYWSVRNREDIVRAIPLFDSLLPESQKKRQYDEWKKKWKKKLDVWTTCKT